MIERDWLETEVAFLFRHHRRRVVRRWQGEEREVTYHTPTPPQPYHRTPWGWLMAPWRVNYPHQWFWDSVAHAIVLRHLDPALAREELRALLLAQAPDGFIPHVIWDPAHHHWVDRLLGHIYPSSLGSPYLGPPVLALGVEAVWQTEPDRDFLAEALPRLVAYYEYLHRERGTSGDGLVEIIHSYESGRDQGTEYDAVYGGDNSTPAWRGPMLRLMLHHRSLGWDTGRILGAGRFQVKDLLFNCTYAASLRALSRLLTAAGEVGPAALFWERAERAEAAILGKMYHPPTGLFYSLDSRPGRGDDPLLVPSVAAFFPLLLETIDRERVEGLVAHLTSPGEFWAPYPVPAEPVGVPPHPRAIWRGAQTWLYPNWFICRGLQLQAGRFPHLSAHLHHIAAEITRRSYELVRQEGFREHYHALTGQGMRARDFAWSTLVLDMVIAGPPAMILTQVRPVRSADSAGQSPSGADSPDSIGIPCRDDTSFGAGGKKQDG